MTGLTQLAIGAGSGLAVALFNHMLKRERDLGRLEGEMSAMTRVISKDRREDRRALSESGVLSAPKKKRSIMRHLLKIED